MFFLSGAAGLIYELTWVRLFSVAFGNSTHAISLVVAVFMAGLALGAFLLGRISDRWPEPLVLYGVIELGIAASGLLVPHLLRSAEPAIAALYESGVPPLARLTVLRVSMATVVMVVPTTLMGATLPIITKHFVQQPREIGEKVGLLYGLNTLGAVLGCFLTGFYLIRVLGVTNSSYLGSSINGTIGVVAILARYPGRWRLLGLGLHGRGVASSRQKIWSPESALRRRPSRLAVLVALFVSGFTALSYEVVWSRILGFVFQLGMSTFAFTIVLTVFLAGLGIGGLIYARWANEIDDTVGLFGLLQVLVGATVLAGVFLFAQWDSPRVLRVSAHFWVNDFFKAGFLMLAPAILMGIGFPLGCRVITERTHALGGTIGEAYAVNTLGSVLGPLITGFLLIPLAGTESVLKIMVTANVATGLMLVVLGGTPRRLTRGRMVWAVAILIAVVIVDASRTELVLSLFNARREPVVYFREGPSDSLLATRLRDGIQLIVGGSTGAGSTPVYQRTDELLAYIPLLLHSTPRDVAVIGFGTGRTAGLYGEHPSVRRVEVVEIAQGALDSGRDVFASFNRGVLSNPKVRTILDDGFNFMKYTPGRYDIISIDPFTPRNPGSARLYTREFLLSVKGKVKDPGIVVMWAFPPRVHTTSFRLALKTFQAVFPRTTVWTSPVDQMFLFVATSEPLQFDVAELADRLAARPRQDRYPYHIRDVIGFLSLLFLDEAAVEEIVAREETPVFTVDRPNLEFVYLSDRSPALDWAWRRRVKSSVLPKLRNVPKELEKRLWQEQN